MRRRYLPKNLTPREKRSPKLRRKLSRCIKKVELQMCPRSAKRKDGTYNYERCRGNPISICRASLKK